MCPGFHQGSQRCLLLSLLPTHWQRQSNSSVGVLSALSSSSSSSSSPLPPSAAARPPFCEMVSFYRRSVKTRGGRAVIAFGGRRQRRRRRRFALRRVHTLETCAALVRRRAIQPVDSRLADGRTDGQESQDRHRSIKGIAATATEATFSKVIPEGNFLVQKLCRFKNIVLFNKNGPIGRVRQAL